MMKQISNILLLVLAAFLLLQAGFSIHWPITHDEAPLLYESFLMHREGRVPYRDMFDFQMPGIYAAFYLIGSVSGFNPFRLRVLDLLILTAILIITYNAMRTFGKVPALAGGFLFGLGYIGGGPSLALQREYLMLLFLAPAVWISMRGMLTLKHRFALGILFGLTTIIKPHAAIGLLPILLFDLHADFKRRNIPLLHALAGNMIPLGLGFALPVSAVLLWLSVSGALKPFISIVMNYWPLYSQINGRMEVTSGTGRLAFILDQVWRLGGNGLWLVPALIGVYLVPEHQKRWAYLLAGWALCYAIYPALSGQFFPYHYIPFLYFIVLLSALCLVEAKPRAVGLIPLLLVIVINIRPSPVIMRQLEGKPIATSTDRAGELLRFLEKHLEEGDAVQPLDWTGGALLAMLEARAPMATPYVFDYYFYHHLSEPYIQSLREDFLNRLLDSRPRFIIEVTAVDKPWVSGPDTSKDFPELRSFLDGYYAVVVRKDDYMIYERR
jgi:hypothetical protein